MDYFVCKLLNRTPTEIKDIDPYDIAFLKAGMGWEMEFRGRRKQENIFPV